MTSFPGHSKPLNCLWITQGHGYYIVMYLTTSMLAWRQPTPSFKTSVLLSVGHADLDSTRLPVDPENRRHENIGGMSSPRSSESSKRDRHLTIIEYDICQDRVQSAGFSDSSRRQWLTVWTREPRFHRWILTGEQKLAMWMGYEQHVYWHEVAQWVSNKDLQILVG